MNEDLSDIRKEKVKLRATFLNSIGIGVILIGTLTPIIRLIYGEGGSSADTVLTLGTPFGCFIIGITLHWLAMNALGRLKT